MNYDSPTGEMNYEYELKAKRRVRKGLTLVRIPKSGLPNPLEIRRHWRLPMRPRIGSLTGLNHFVLNYEL